MNQRSQDMLTANSWNVCQYAALLHLFARASGLVAGELVHVIADAHIYDRHVPIVEELMSREGFAAPELKIDPEVTDFYKFSTDNVWLEGYENCGGVGKIPVAV